MFDALGEWQLEAASGRHRRAAPALACSAGLHAAAIAAALLAVSHAAGSLSDSSRGALLPQTLVWLNQPGPAGGGGGGGNRRLESVARLTVAGSESVSMPAAARPPLEVPMSVPDDAPELAQAFVIPVAFSGAALDTRPGLPDGSARDSASRGPGDGPGAGSGRGSGAGAGDGPGIGEGTSGGTDGGYFLPGAGIETPVPIRKVKPIYTTEAMRLRIQGSAWIECIVLPDGTVGRMRLVRSLDPVYGLDQEAVKAARQWRFRPGRRNGLPVAVLVTIAIDFNLF